MVTRPRALVPMCASNRNLGRRSGPIREEGEDGSWGNNRPLFSSGSWATTDVGQPSGGVEASGDSQVFYGAGYRSRDGAVPAC